MWHEHPGVPSCIDALAGDIIRRLGAHLQGAQTATLYVSGGRSPIPLFERLADSPLEWSRIRIRLVDERHVPPEHPASNEGLVRRHLLQGKAAAADFRGLYLPNAALSDAVAAANREAYPIDVAVLGMGEDGHTASLFPEAPQLDVALSPDAARYVHVTPLHAPHERITLSLSALQAAGHLLMYIAGAQKRRVYKEAQQKISKRLPVSYLAADPGVRLDVHWHP